ncbi:hypothetical protein O181_070596 [Austropuccinia psidii MF-1]|uniref:Uncharacterized protein n=1 Tax=Austropuccinia psidii MF-1 TaxID=1389203 RepID=A0A9Q3EZ30_9BASI|nr:hypothetical protein [Austropuccinia psidii MF-1]
MSSRLTSLYDSNHSDSPPSALYGPSVFDNLRELSEASMAPTEIYDITRNYNGFKSTRCKFCNLGKRNCSQANHSFPDKPRKFWSSIKKGGRFGLEAPVDEPPPLMLPLVTPIQFLGQHWRSHSPQGNPIGVSPEVPILVTRKDWRLGKLKRNLVVQDEIDSDAGGSDEIDGEQLEMTNPIQKRRIHSPSRSPFQASTTKHEVIRPPQPPQPLIRSPTRPSTLDTTSTSIQPPAASTSRDPMSPEPESKFETCHCWNITIFAEIDPLTEVFVDKALKSAIPGEPTSALAKEAVSYEDAMVVKLREALKKF